MTRQPIGLDDLAVGQRFLSDRHVVTQEEIVAFASRYDPQPFHTDPEAAAGTFFGGLAASGWHTAALSMRLLVDAFPIRNGIIGSGGELLWPKPVRAGDALTVEGEILSITPSRSKPNRAAVVVRLLTRNGAGEVVQSFTPTMVVTR